MHISEGMLAAPVLGAGWAAAAAGTYIGIRRIDTQCAPRIGLTAAFLFAASLVAVPIPGTSVHLVLNGMAGILLGWAVFPAFFVVLLLQAALFSFGGLTTLGVNTANMALPGLVCCLLLRRAVASGGRRGTAAAFAAGSMSVLLAALMMGLCLATVSTKMAVVAFTAQVPLALVEGLVCVFLAAFLRKVRPELLSPARLEAR